VVCSFGVSTSKCQCSLFKKIQLTRFAAYPDGSLSHLIRISGVLLYLHYKIDIIIIIVIIITIIIITTNIFLMTALAARRY